MAEPQLYQTGTSEPVEAMQLALEDPMVAEKDFEEHNRHVGAWIVNNDGEAHTVGRKYLAVLTSDGLKNAGPGDWVVKELNGFSVYLKNKFEAKYKKV